jgi:hypothetical protein
MNGIDWRNLPGLANLDVDQAKVDFLWQYVGSKVPAVHANEVARFCLAIIPQEGTGSFDTSSVNKAADGGNGYEADWCVDVRRAVDLVIGKLMLYKQACEQGFVSLAQQVVSPDAGACDGGPDQWVNWATAVARNPVLVESGACYAQHASWWAGVRHHYLAWGGSMQALTEAANALDAGAPGVSLSMQYVTGKTWLASNWNATAPEPAVIVASAAIVKREAPAPAWDPVAEIARLKERGVINTTHAPEEPLNWGTFATVLNRLLDKKG